MALNTIKPNSIEDAGLIICSALRTPRTGYLYCDGSALSRTTYANLFSNIVPNLGTVSITIASPGVVTLASHGLLTGESIYLTTTGALPTGLVANTLYYIITVDANTFRLATTYANAISGTAINTSATQSGTHTLFFCPFGLGNGSTTFNIPDLRGAYMRGRGTSSAFTQNRTSGMGERLSDALQNITGGFGNLMHGAGAGAYANGVFVNNAGGDTGNGGTFGGNVNQFTFDASRVARTSTETRPNSVVLNYFIRF